MPPEFDLDSTDGPTLMAVKYSPLSWWRSPWRSTFQEGSNRISHTHTSYTVTNYLTPVQSCADLWPRVRTIEERCTTSMVPAALVACWYCSLRLMSLIGQSPSTKKRSYFTGMVVPLERSPARIEPRSRTFLNRQTVCQ